MKKKLVFIKLGGSIITDKTKPLTPAYETINRIASELKRIIKNLAPHHYFIIGHGAGSFGHYFATKYNTSEGVHTKKQQFGFSIEQFHDVKLNQIILDILLRHKINAHSFHASSMFFVSGGKVKKAFLDVLWGSLRAGIIPVVYGNIVFDAKKGCHILSTESIFNEIIENADKKELKLEKAIYLTTVNGFMNSNGEVIPSVTPHNYPSFKKHFFSMEGMDVTGGMKQKVENALRMAEKKIKTYIVNGRKKDVLSTVFFDKKFEGTIVSREQPRGFVRSSDRAQSEKNYTRVYNRV